MCVCACIISYHEVHRGYFERGIYKIIALHMWQIVFRGHLILVDLMSSGPTGGQVHGACCTFIRRFMDGAFDFN